jgi:hypothetical protein
VYHLSAQKVSDFAAFQILNFQINDAQPTTENVLGVEKEGGIKKPFCLIFILAEI